MQLYLFAVSIFIIAGARYMSEMEDIEIEEKENSKKHSNLSIKKIKMQSVNTYYFKNHFKTVLLI